MIKSVQIKNFKSIVDLPLELGTFNVLIGENGCGKSNILEALAFGAAASADKLDYEFLGSRGIRVTNSEFMFSAFGNGKREKVIRLDFNIDNENHFFELINDEKNNRKWIDKSLERIKDLKVPEKFDALKNDFNQDKEKIIKEIDELNEEVEKIIKNENSEKSLSEVNEISNKIKEFEEKLITIHKFKKELEEKEKEFSNLYENINLSSYRPDISNYVIYSPEQSNLRKFEDTNQIYPLGIKGEGLFRYLKELALDKKNNKTLKEIKENLMLLDWYEDFDLPENLMQNEFSLKIKDKYLAENLKYFDQRSTNEGFLFLLFYSTLFISKATPTFFAIDNIDTSLNPKLCMQLIRNLAALAKKHKKQVILTTHNPAVLDGLNLKDDNQRLFVISRNSAGHTRKERINYNEKRTMKLSELWTKGFIGGLPDNF